MAFTYDIEIKTKKVRDGDGSRTRRIISVTVLDLGNETFVPFTKEASGYPVVYADLIPMAVELKTAINKELKDRIDEVAEAAAEDALLGGVINELTIYLTANVGV